MKYWQVELTGWFIPKVLNHGITLYVQLVSTSCLVQNFWNESPCKFNLSVLHVWFKTLIARWLLNTNQSINQSINQKFWTRHEVLTSWTYRVITSKGFEPPCIFNLSVLHVWFKTWMESPCMFNLFGSKLLDGIFLYVQFVSTSCLVQTFVWQIEHSGRFNPKVLNQTWRTNKLNIKGDSIQMF
jgi:hypothetical protein